MTTYTDYSKKCEILNDLWINHINNEMFYDFIEVNDLGLPMSHFIFEGIVESTPLAQEIVEQSFEDLLELLEIKDVGFTNLKQMV
jgi:hypothetical protein